MTVAMKPATTAEREQSLSSLFMTPRKTGLAIRDAVRTALVVVVAYESVKRRVDGAFPIHRRHSQKRWMKRASSTLRPPDDIDQQSALIRLPAKPADAGYAARPLAPAPAATGSRTSPRRSALPRHGHGLLRDRR